MQNETTETETGTEKAVEIQPVVMDLRMQVRNQHKAVAHLARAVADLADSKLMLIDSGGADEIMGIIGDRSAYWMEVLGDMLNACDAVTEEDDWMAPVFEKAQEMYPQD